jgi:ribonuclease P protein component
LSRFAYAIPKRVGTAVARNRLRRRLREAIRMLPLLEGYDVVVMTRPEAAQASFQALRQELILLFRRSKLLDAPASPPIPPSG